jgi:hypothetical protein
MLELQVKAYENENRLPGGLARMGKTVPSYRMALEDEIDRWKSFRNALASEEEKAAFDVLMDICRSNGMAVSAACNPIVFEPMAMCILLAQQKNIRAVEKKLTGIAQLSK